MKKITLAIAEDQDILRGAYVSLLDDSNVEITGLFSNGKQLVKWLKNNTVDVVLLDVNMPLMDGIEVLHYFNKNKINQKSLIVSEHLSDSFFLSTLELGCNGYLDKMHAHEFLENAIEQIYQGKTYCSDDLHNQLKEIEELNVIHDSLSEREKELLPLLEQYSYVEIADKFNISKSSVKTYFSRIREKFNTQSNIELAFKVHKIRS